MSLAALATSWASYQASLWSGEQAEHTASAAAVRAKATRAYNRADDLRMIDIGTFAHWMTAKAGNDSALAGFIAARFRHEFKPAFESWIASRPLTLAGRGRDALRAPELSAHRGCRRGQPRPRRRSRGGGKPSRQPDQRRLRAERRHHGDGAVLRRRGARRRASVSPRDAPDRHGHVRDGRHPIDRGASGLTRPRRVTQRALRGASAAGSVRCRTAPTAPCSARNAPPCSTTMERLMASPNPSP